MQNLYHVIQTLCGMFETQSRRAAMQPARGQMHAKKDTDLVYIASLAMNLVKRLGEKTVDPNDKSGGAEAFRPARCRARRCCSACCRCTAASGRSGGCCRTSVAYARLAGLGRPRSTQEGGILVVGGAGND